MVEDEQITLKTYTDDELSDFKWLLSLPKHNQFIIKMINFAHKSIYEHQEGRWREKRHPEGWSYYGIINYLNGTPYWGANNRLNTNYSGLTHLKHGLNNLLIQDGIKDIIIFNHNYSHDYDELQKMEKYLLQEKYRNILLSDKFNFYYEIEAICHNSWELSKIYTRDFKENYKRYLPWAIGIDINDDLPGDPIDMFDGNDCYIIFTGKTIITLHRKAGVQIKKVKSVYLRDNGLYYIKVSMIPEKYKRTQLFVFYTSKLNVFIFKNNISGIKSIEENKIMYVTISKDLIRYPNQ